MKRKIMHEKIIYEIYEITKHKKINVEYKRRK